MSLLTYPFDDKNSPISEAIERKVSGFIDDYDCLRLDLKLKYKESCFGDLTTRFFPNASDEVLTAAARHMVLFFAFDDVYGLHDINGLNDACQQAISILEGHRPAYPVNEVFNQFDVLRTELLSFTNAEWRTRYIQNIRQYFEAMFTETHFTQSHTYPNKDYYAILRENLVGLYQLVDFVELESDFIMPYEILTHPYTRRIRQLAVRVMAWCNDYFSAPKEIAAGELMNLVLIIQQEKGCKIDDAYNQVVNIHNSEMDEFIQLCESQPDFGKHNYRYSNYVYNLKLMVQGHKVWTENTFRYNVR